MHQGEIARATVIEHVLAERERQEELWGDQVNNTDETWSVIAMEELGEVARNVYESQLGLAYVELV